MPLQTTFLLDSVLINLTNHNVQIYAWGYNGNGQLGIGNTTNQPTPRISQLTGQAVVIKVKCAQFHYIECTYQYVPIAVDNSNLMKRSIAVRNYWPLMLTRAHYWMQSALF